MHPKPQILHLSQIFLVVALAFILYGYNQAGLSALLDLPDVVCYFPQVDTINTTGAEEARNSTIKGLVNACLQIGLLWVLYPVRPSETLLVAERASSLRVYSH